MYSDPLQLNLNHSHVIIIVHFLLKVLILYIHAKYQLVILKFFGKLSYGFIVICIEICGKCNVLNKTRSIHDNGRYIVVRVVYNPYDRPLSTVVYQWF